MSRDLSDLKRKQGFTLIEILIVVMLTGMVSALALAPVVMTVRNVVEIQDEWSDTEALSRALTFIGRDAAAAVRISEPAVIITHHEKFNAGDDDVLIVMTTAPSRQMLSAGSVVYKLIDSDAGKFTGSGSVIPGLYRWVLEGVLPRDVKVNNLTVDGMGSGLSEQTQKPGQLVLPWATEFSVAIPQLDKEKSDWVRTYSGKLPSALFLALTRKRNTGMGFSELTGTTTSINTRGETREEIFVFP